MRNPFARKREPEPQAEPEQKVPKSASAFEDSVLRAITQAKVTMLFKHPFFGNIAGRLKLRDASDWCSTAATDGRHLYYNREFIKSLSKPELVFLVAHEVLHLVLDHLGGRNKRDPGLWNMANDYVVNGILHDEKIGTMPTRIVLRDDKSKDGISQRVGLFDPKYRGWSSPQVYEDLKKNSVEVVITLDDHLDWGNGKDTKGKDRSVSVRVMGNSGGGPPNLTEEELRQIRDEIKNAMIHAASAAAGRIPAGIKRLIQDLVEPKMDWRQLLEMHIQSVRKGDFTFQTPSRKGQMTGVILPGQKREPAVDVVACIDASGSIGEEQMRDFVSEILGILDQFEDFRLTLWSFDTQVYNVQMFTPENRDDIYAWEPHGGGGTIFECNWDYMKENEILPHRFVMFTDGLPNRGWGDEDYCDTLFVIHNTRQNIEAPFGLSVQYEAKEQNLGTQ